MGRNVFSNLYYNNLDDTLNVIAKIVAGNVRVNCLDASGLNLLDQACFKGNEELVDYLLWAGANVDNRAHDAGYTCLMFAALAG